MRAAPRLPRWRRSLFFLAAALLALAAGCGGGENDANDPIVFSDLNWPSAEIQNRIAGFIVEHGYGYPVEYVPGESVSLWQGLLNNDTDITMEVWLPNSQLLYEQGIADGLVVDAGYSMDSNWQGFAIPQYIKDQNPGLVSVADLPDYIHLFVTPESHGKARFVNCLVGWICAQVNEEKLESYGLTEYLDLVDPGSTAALIADLDAAFAAGRGWLGYMWGPSIPSTNFDLYLLEEPPHNDDCWARGKSCAYPIAEIKIVVHHSLPDRAPGIFEFLNRWDFSAESYVTTAAWMTENDKTPDDAALWFLRNRREIWTAILPNDIAERVDAALADLDDAR